MNLKLTLTFLAFATLTTAFAQETFKTCYVKGDSCYSVTYSTTTARDYSGRHILFRAPKGQQPKRLSRLGSNPQFETLRFYTTTQEVYDHLHRIYGENKKGNAAELDNLWRAMGYTGFKDARYTVEDVTPVYHDPGVVGMLGAGGHSYLYAKVYNNGTGKPLKGYRMTAPDGNDITIMEICGNAFIEDVDIKPTQVISKKACKLDLQPGEDLSKKSVNAFLKDGKCYVRICDKPASEENGAPVKVSTLAHDQQFGPMTELKTSEEVYGRLQSLYTENKRGNRAEIDRLLKTIGYTNGFNDERFNAQTISIVNYEGGVAAVMGGGEHQYMFSEISTENYDNLRGFLVKSLNDECDLTIIDVCGNALYCPQPMNCRTIECGCN
jgi:hypothetical protein